MSQSVFECAACIRWRDAAGLGTWRPLALVLLRQRPLFAHAMLPPLSMQPDVCDATTAARGHIYCKLGNVEACKCPWQSACTGGAGGDKYCEVRHARMCGARGKLAGPQQWAAGRHAAGATRACASAVAAPGVRVSLVHVLCRPPRLACRPSRRGSAMRWRTAGTAGRGLWPAPASTAACQMTRCRMMMSTIASCEGEDTSSWAGWTCHCQGTSSVEEGAGVVTDLARRLVPRLETVEFGDVDAKTFHEASAGLLQD